MKILMVERSWAICERLLALLDKSGKYVGLGCVSSSPAVLELVETSRPDAILLDLRLDDTDGFQLLELLRSRGLTIPVVMLSMSHGWQYRIRAQAAGADAFLCKCTQFDEILPTLDHLLARKGNPVAKRVEAVT